MADCQIFGCDEAIKYSAEFPLCPYHFRQKISIDSNHCLIKLCENEPHEAFSFCERHCDEFFEKEVENKYLKEQIIKLKDELQKESNNAYRLRNVIQEIFQGMKKEEKPEKPSLTREILKNDGVVMCTVDTMKKILNGVV